MNRNKQKHENPESDIVFERTGNETREEAIIAKAFRKTVKRERRETHSVPTKRKINKAWSRIRDILIGVAIALIAQYLGRLLGLS
jgi:hypothetical protein